MADIELKPCPFCGGKAFLDSDFSGIYCRCGAESTFFKTDKEAAERWNSRPIEDALQKNIMDLTAKLETAKEALNWITNCKPVIDCGYFEIMEKARIALEEIENDKQS